MLNNNRKNSYKFEYILKGVANKRRIEILLLLSEKSELSVNEITKEVGGKFRNISAHIIKLMSAGLIMKRSEGLVVRHKLTEKGKTVVFFLNQLSKKF